MKRTRRGHFSFELLPTPLTTEQLVDKLTEKGLDMSGDERPLIARRLEEVDYYRLRGYWLTLEYAERHGDETDWRFKDGTTFEDIWEIHALDSKLRNWLWEANGPIEVKLHSQFAQHVALTGEALGVSGDSIRRCRESSD